jgi:hypothetical protein
MRRVALAARRGPGAATRSGLATSAAVQAATVILVLGAMTSCASRVAGGSTDATRVRCTAGPLPAWFGALPWLAYACDDGRSVALVSAPGNPAAPFTFVVRPTPERVRVQGEGSGDRAATAAAFAELMALDDADVARLYGQAFLESTPDGG